MESPQIKFTVKKTRFQLHQFLMANQGWLKNNKNFPADMPLNDKNAYIREMAPLEKAIDTVNDRIHILMQPVYSISPRTQKALQDIMVDMCDNVSVETMPNPQTGQDMNYTKYLFTNKESYKEYLERRKNIEKDAEQLTDKLMNEEVDFEPKYADILPSLQLLPQQFRDAFRGFVIPEQHFPKEKKEKEADKDNMRVLGFVPPVGKS